MHRRNPGKGTLAANAIKAKSTTTCASDPNTPPKSCKGHPSDFVYNSAASIR